MQLQETEYKKWIIEVKSKIRSAQIKATITVNRALIEFYWDLGKMITEKQTVWGSQFLNKLSQDLKHEFPDMEGLSVRNLKYTRQFYQFYNLTSNQQSIEEFGQQLVAQIPWGHNILIFSKAKSLNEARFYIQQTLENGWSRDILGLQIKSDLYARQGKAIHNFVNTLPDPMSDLAGQLLKDPYNFDFLSMTQNYKERELENALVDNVTKFLLELGSGFAYVGKQVPIEVGGQEFFIDLLFYRLKLRAYVVIELKVTDFTPEHAGKLSFYLSVANDQLKHTSDNPTIGLLICKNKNDIVAEYALKDIKQPIGVTEYQLTKLFPEEFKSSLPTIEEIEEELKNV
ncbi:MAG: PDDEXK nuclease domain-containing protein [Arcicella sp.]|nr:PDDEXK nuclease domain-containing protein [Arcicella sp.]